MPCARRSLPFVALPLVGFLLAARAPAAEAAGETQAAERIAYEKHVLDNGMTLILHEDHALPIVAVNLWVRVGAKDEPASRSGFAHLFEHLMFMGTRRVPTGQFDLIMEGAGGSNNASTSLDRTNYFSSGPAGLLPTLLWLEADRLEDLGAFMTREKLDLQRDVVLNEKKESYDNQPYGLSELVLYEALFPEGHPYRYDVIGRDEDIRNATLEDVQRFFATYYVPNNVSLVVAGDFDPVSVKADVARWFGTLPRAADPPPRTAPPARFPGIVRRTVTDAVSLPRVTFAWHTPPIHQPGDAELDLLASLLAEGKDSRLYRRLVHQDGLAAEVSAFQGSEVLGSVFRIEVYVKPGVDLATVERVVDEELERLRTEAPPEAEVAKVRAGIEHRTVEGLQSIENRADVLNAYEFHFGEPDSLARDLARYRTATPTSVRATAAEWLVPDRRVILRVLPEGQEAPPAENPRDVPPAALPERPFAPPVPEAFRLPNGLAVWHLDRPAVPLVALHLVMPAGSAEDGPGREGLASLTAAMLTEGAGERDAVAYAGELARLGTVLSAAADRDGTHVSLHVLRSGLEEALGLFADGVVRPRLLEADFQRARALRIAALRRRDDDPVELARRLGFQGYFGKDHPYGHAPEGVPASLQGLTLADVREFHAERYRPDGATLVVAGDVRRADLERMLLATLGAWKIEAPPPAPASVPAPASGGLRVLVVDRPGAEQTAVRFVFPGPAYAAEDRVDLDLVNVLFGGSFSSRLQSNLRETHGWTYNASSAFVNWRHAGLFVVGAPVRADATGPALGEFLRELDRLASGDVSREETAKARASWRAGLVASFQSLEGVVGAYAAIAGVGGAREALGADAGRATAATQEDLNARARARLSRREGVLVLVGDRARIVAGLEGLGLPAPTFVDPAADR